VQSWHSANGASPFGVARAACFEELAGVFASSGALLLAKNVGFIAKVLQKFLYISFA
jgi:hypothetical protein